MYSLFMALPLKNPALLLTWRPPVVKRMVPSSPRLLVNCPFVPHCSQMFLASLPPGFPQNPNVLLIRTHPNPFPSVGYINISVTKSSSYTTYVSQFWKSLDPDPHWIRFQTLEPDPHRDLKLDPVTPKKNADSCSVADPDHFPELDLFLSVLGSGSVSYSMRRTQLFRSKNLTKYAFWLGPGGLTDKENHVQMYKKYYFLYITSLKK
jgi:hypothetical protein